MKRTQQFSFTAIVNSDGLVTITAVANKSGKFATSIAFPRKVKVGASMRVVRAIALDANSRSDVLEWVEEIALPEGLKVIGDKCFSGLRKLRKVDFPSTLVAIGKSAFQGCRRLKEVMLPEGLRTIGENAFFMLGCSTCYSRIYVPSTASLAHMAFGRAYLGRAEVMCPTIDEAAFKMTTFRALSLSPMLRAILEEAFAFSNALYLLRELPQTLHLLGRGAFMYPDSRRAYVPHTLHIRGDVVVSPEVFKGASMLGSIETGHRTWRALMEADFTFASSGITRVFIPDGTMCLGEEVCAKCEKLRSINIPKSVTRCKQNALKGAGLANLVIPDSRKTIDEGAFSDLGNCDYIYASKYNWSRLVLNKGIAGNGMRHITIPEGIENLFDSALAHCKRLFSVTLPSTLSFIGDRVFEGCTQLQEIAIVPSVKTIGPSAFKDCHSLRRIKMEEGLTRICDAAFDGCRSLTELVIPSTVAEFGDGCFKWCFSLKQIAFNAPPGQLAYPMDCPAHIDWYVPDQWVDHARAIFPNRRIFPLSDHQPCAPLPKKKRREDGKREVALTITPELMGEALYAAFVVKDEHKPLLKAPYGPQMLMSRYMRHNLAECDFVPVEIVSDNVIAECLVEDPKNGMHVFTCHSWSAYFEPAPLLYPSTAVLQRQEMSFYIEATLLLDENEEFKDECIKFRKYSFDKMVVIDFSGVIYHDRWIPARLYLKEKENDFEYIWRQRRAENYLCDDRCLRRINVDSWTIEMPFPEDAFITTPIRMTASDCIPQKVIALNRFLRKC